MKDIKFRAWDKLNDCYHYYADYLQEGKECKEYYIAKAQGDLLFMALSHVWIIEFFTGLKDKNRKDIYEGDTIESARYGKFVVEWRDSTCGFYPFNMPNNVPDNETCEVIGNIYENSELIEKGEKK